MDTDKIIITVTSTALAGAAALLLLSEVSHSLTMSEYELKMSQRESKIEYLQEELLLANEELDRFINPLPYDRDPAPLYDIPLDEELQQYTYDMCSYYDIVDYYEVVLALMWRESNFYAEAMSSTDDYGIMQINKCNHEYLKEELGVVDIMDVKSNIEGGVYILSTLFREYDDAHEVLMAYNMGPSRATSLWSRGTYSSSYSRDIMSKAEQIRMNNYFSE